MNTIITLAHIQTQAPGYQVRTWPRPKPYNPSKDAYASFDKALEAGRSSLVGNAHAAEFLSRYRSPLTAWQKLAYHFALQNPQVYLIVESRAQYWQISLRGEYVEFHLPHQDQGGELTYISNDGRSKIKVNED